MLVPAFADSLSVFEAATVREAVAANSTTFSDIQKDILMTIFSRYGCREYPTPKNIHSLTENTARFEFTIKPMAAYSMMSSGIPLEERLFWQSFSLEELHSLYMAINATPGKVLALFQEPTLASEAEQRVFTYLQQFVGNMKVDELRSFLRFTTGSSALMAENIIVTFNSTTGMARRPIAHTCGCVLMTIFSRYGCREYPTPKNIHSLIENTARFEFMIKPMAAYSMMSSGINLEERLFWQSFSLEEMSRYWDTILYIECRVLSYSSIPLSSRGLTFCCIN